MLDVGAVARALVEECAPPLLLHTLAEPLGVNDSMASACLGFIVSLHDLGKISPGFQNKQPRLRPTPGNDFGYTASDETDHAVVTCYAVRKVLIESCCCRERRQAKEIALAVSGHHGVFPGDYDIRMASERGAWGEARSACAEELRRIFGVAWENLQIPQAPLPSGWLMMIAGLTSVADWLASDQESFPLAGNVGSLADYAGWSLARAREVLRRTGWRRLPERDHVCGFADLFPQINGAPNGMQKTCERLAREAQAPFLLLVEAPMGQGKTEAALWAAEVARRRLGMTGIYYALPTQATSNQMFMRLLKFLTGRFTDGPVEFQLLHGMAEFNEAFEELRSATAEYEPHPQDVHAPRDTHGTEGSVEAHEWFRARKRGLLAPFAVGTVDQALLGALTMRHMFVRLFGLAHKTVIIDEVHAYDVYMSTLLDRLIEWLAAVGSNVVLLSATLPKARRRELLEAYAGHAISDADARYPSVHLVTRGRTACESLPEEELRTVRVGPCAGGIPGALDLLSVRLKGGGCAAWICNTVGQAQKAFEALESDSRFADIPEEDRILFHARFLAKDRLRIERDVLAKFGKSEGGQSDRRPRKAVVVATQVIEQSLDLDFDVMMTELPPADLLLQRMGRLHRHRARDAARPVLLKEPAIYWIEPELDFQGRPEFTLSGRIYQPYVLFRTWRLVRERSSVRLPQDVEAWIEAVYGNMDETQPFLQEVKQKMEEDRFTERGAAKRRIMPPPDIEDGVLDELCTRMVYDDDEEKSQAMTRLAEPTVTVVCLHETPSGLSFTSDGGELFNMERKPDRETVKKLLAHSVKMEVSRWEHYKAAHPTPASWSDVAVLRSCRLAPLCNGTLEYRGRRLTLDVRIGLTEERTSN